jgi:hypothetical protein
VDSRKEATEEGASEETAPLLTSTGGGGDDMAGVGSARGSASTPVVAVDPRPLSDRGLRTKSYKLMNLN